MEPSRHFSTVDSLSIKFEKIGAHNVHKGWETTVTVHALELVSWSVDSISINFNRINDIWLYWFIMRARQPSLVLFYLLELS